MVTTDLSVLDLPQGVVPDPGEFVRAAMAWHFSEETGSPFWLERAKTLGFDPRADVTSFEDLRLFPNVTDELRDVHTASLIPRGFGRRPDIVGVIESGGTTGAPKRLPLLREFADRMAASEAASLGRLGISTTDSWLAMFPSGPHAAFEQMKRAAAVYGDGILVFGIDLDPRWVKKQATAGRSEVVDEYIDHILDQASFILKSEEIGVLRLTAPVLARLVARDDLVQIVRDRVRLITWGGAHMDADSRYFYRTEVFPETRLMGRYGTTMALGAGAVERPDLADDADCVFDPSLSPHVTLTVVDPATREPVAVGERGQVVVNHLSKSFLLPNNAERDTAVRMAAVGDQVGDSVAEILPLVEFGGTAVVEGVY